MIAGILDAFVDGFNTNSLDDVMEFFAEDAVYEPGDGRTHRGRAHRKIGPRFYLQASR